MSFGISDNDPVMNEINMTPLVDVMLVLLVVFMVTLPVAQQAVKVELPRNSIAPDIARPDALRLTVDAQGRFYLDQQAVPADALEDALRTQAARQPQPQLHIRGDKKVPYEQVAMAMTAAQRAGMTRVAFITESKIP